LPSRRTDQHALAVLIYEYLLGRHPLRGPKVNSVTSPKKMSGFRWGQKRCGSRTKTPAIVREASGFRTKFWALFGALVERAFTVGLHEPDERPGADEWERALVRTTDLLLPCANADCSQKWFVLTGTSPRCPFCGQRVRGSLPILNFYRAGRPGQFVTESIAWHLASPAFVSLARLR
jgi:DNA-binding helix-hairpin-helix protein with protein kinase domain